MQNSVWNLRAVDTNYLNTKELVTKVPLLKQTFLLKKKFNLQIWENTFEMFFPYTENLTTETVLQSIFSLTKMSSSGKKKKNLFYEEYILVASSSAVISKKILIWSFRNTPYFPWKTLLVLIHSKILDIWNILISSFSSNEDFQTWQHFTTHLPENCINILSNRNFRFRRVLNCRK